MGALRGLPLEVGPQARRDPARARTASATMSTSRSRASPRAWRRPSNCSARSSTSRSWSCSTSPSPGLDAINQGRLEHLIRDEAAAGTHGHLLDPRHPPCRAPVRADRDHRRRPDPLRGPGHRRARPAAAAGAAQDPQRPTARGAPRCPADAARRDGHWQFELPKAGIEPLLKALIDGGAGIEELSIERRGLHDAFVAIAGESGGARDGGERAADLGEAA